jgi:hypothetical protein
MIRSEIFLRSTTIHSIPANHGAPVFRPASADRGAALRQRRSEDRHSVWILWLFGIILFAACGPSPTASAVLGTPPDPTIEPIQSTTAAPAFTIRRGDYDFTLTPISAYEISAEVVSTKRYRSGWNALVSPVDLALAWSELTSEEAKKHITYSQGNRWYYFRYDGASPFDGVTISKQSANVHILPGNGNIEAAALSLRAGDRVRLKGWLIDLDGRTTGDRTVWWRTSRTRDDTGDGSCEVMWVTEIQKGTTVYR